MGRRARAHWAPYPLHLARLPELEQLLTAALLLFVSLPAARQQLLDLRRTPQLLLPQVVLLRPVDAVLHPLPQRLRAHQELPVLPWLAPKPLAKAQQPLICSPRAVTQLTRQLGPCRLRLELCLPLSMALQPPALPDAYLSRAGNYTSTVRKRHLVSKMCHS